MIRVVCPVCKAGFEARVTLQNCAINCVTCGVAFNASNFLPKGGDARRAQEPRPQGSGYQEPRPQGSGKEKFERYTGPVLIDPPKLTDTHTAGLPFLAADANSAVATLEAPKQRKGIPEPLPLPKLPKQDARHEARQEPRPQGSGHAVQEPRPQGSGKPGPVLIDASAKKDSSNEKRDTKLDPVLTPSSRLESLMSSLQIQPATELALSTQHSALGTNNIPAPTPAPAASKTSAKPDDIVIDPLVQPVLQEPRPQGSGMKRNRRPLLEGAFGKYDIEGEIARGGVGAVFRARERDSGKPFALKVLIEGDDVGETERERFRHECETAKALSLPGMVHIHEVGEHEGRPYMAMELVEGKSLDKVISERSLTVNDCLILMKSVANTVGALHEAGYVHRDLKPGNILLDAFNTPKVADFGLVKSLDEVTRMTASGLVCGTPAYMSPEQARGEGKNVDPRSDVWALGAVLYETLAGEPPFKADNALKLMLRITKESPRKLGSVNRKVPRDVEDIVNKCLEKNPARRYPNGRALATDITTFLEGGQLHITTQSKMKKLMASASANRAKLVPAIAALVAIGILGIVARAIFVTRDAAPFIEKGIAALKENPQNDDKKLQIAQRHFQDALALEPKSGKAYWGLGVALARRGIDQTSHRVLNAKYVEEAFRANDYAVKLDPTLKLDSYANAGRFNFWLGKNVKAAQYWEVVVRANPANLDMRKDLAIAYWHAGVEAREPKYYLLALAEFKAILAANPSYPKITEHIQNIERNFLAANGNTPAVGMAH